jgi:hypothetical protein
MEQIREGSIWPAPIYRKGMKGNEIVVVPHNLFPGRLPPISGRAMFSMVKSG